MYRITVRQKASAMALGLACSSVCASSSVLADSAPWPDAIFSPENFVNHHPSPNRDVGWTSDDIRFWYTSSQGSRLVPYKWFVALEQPGNEDLFIEPAHMRRFNYIDSGGQLPLGFVLDRWAKAGKYAVKTKPTEQTGEAWLGFTCAACHTGQFVVDGKRHLVHGAPATSDFMSFTDGLIDSVNATLSDDDKFTRFQQRVLGNNAPVDSVDALRTQLRDYATWRMSVQSKNGNIGTDFYGYGRLDAVGHILNKVSLVANGSTDNQWPSDAPVSYPHVWNATQQALVQWNGLAANSEKPIELPGGDTDIGALGRNTGEVTGVWADMTVQNIGNTDDYEVHSSANAATLIDLEQILKKLPSPVWPWQDQLDNALVAQGRELYKDHCLSCHTILAPDNTVKKLPVAIPGEITPDNITMNWIHDVGTDIWMACNTDQYGLNRNESTGALDPPDQPASNQGAVILTNVVESTLFNQIGEIAKSVIEDIFATSGGKAPEDAPVVKIDPLEFAPDRDIRKLRRAESCLNKSIDGKARQVAKTYLSAKRDFDDMCFLRRFISWKKKKNLEALRTEYAKYQQLRYKARPLNGIWATAPYLHNGSVPTLADLLLPSNSSDQSGFTLQRQESTSLQAWDSAKSTTESRRPDCFYVGALEYDVVKAGYKSPACSAANDDIPGLFRFDVNNSSGKPIPGNSNAGHNYPSNGLDDTQRGALLEYLKTL